VPLCVGISPILIEKRFARRFSRKQRSREQCILESKVLQKCVLPILGRQADNSLFREMLRPTVTR